MSETKRQRLLKRDYEVLQFEASVLYIKNGLSAEIISKQLNISMPTLSKWNKAGRWSELRPDMNLLKEYKAASLYIEKGLSTGEIAQQLSKPESIISMWVSVNGWDAARLVNQSQNLYIDVVNDFCAFFKTKFPEEASKIEVVEVWYLKNIKSIK